MDRAGFMRLRNMVLEEFNNIEMIINISICYKYFGQLNRAFMFPVLHSEYFSFALRLDILSKIIEDFNPKIKSKLLRMGTIRNIFAHISPNYFDNPDKITFDMLGWFPNPRNINEKLDFEKVHQEFYKLRDEVLPYLDESAIKIGVPFPKSPESDKEKETK